MSGGYWVYYGDGIKTLKTLSKFDVIFTDPPDGIGWKYDSFVDKFDNYTSWLVGQIEQMLGMAKWVVVSYNDRYDIPLKASLPKANWGCLQQFFNFGYYRDDDCRTNNRPLLIGSKTEAVPNGLWFWVPRVHGRSRQRRPWHPTQLNEELLHKIFDLLPEVRSVADPFAGTGTLMRVALARNIPRCVCVDISEMYARKIAEETGATLLKGIK